MMSRSNSSRQMSPGLGNQAAGPDRARKGRAGSVGSGPPGPTGAVMQGGDQTSHRNTMSNQGGNCGSKNTL